MEPDPGQLRGEAGHRPAGGSPPGEASVPRAGGDVSSSAENRPGARGRPAGSRQRKRSYGQPHPAPVPCSGDPAAYRPRDRRRLGAAAEVLAGRYLEARGYRVVARNVRCPLGEADLICRDRDEWVVVEVRARRGHRRGTPEESLDRRKFARLVSVGQWFLARLGRPGDPWRIDLVAVTWPAGEPGPEARRPEIRHYRRLEGGAAR